MDSVSTYIFAVAVNLSGIIATLAHPMMAVSQATSTICQR